MKNPGMAKRNKPRLKELGGGSWTKRTARIGFPILVQYARERRKITYGEWAKIIEPKLGARVNPRKLNGVAGSIGNTCKEYADKTENRIPEINLMVVNKREGIPGEGAALYIKQFCKESLGRRVDPGNLTIEEKRAIIGKAQEEIFDFPDWEGVLKAYGLPTLGRRHRQPKRSRPNPKDWHTGPESEAHKCLKQRIASNPTIVGLKANENGEQEKRLWSGDEVDVYFKRSAVAVEIKAGNAGVSELHRGVFQCVKYKAILCAQQISEGHIPTADCRLAIGRPFPEELQDLCERLGLEYFDKLEE